MMKNKKHLLLTALLAVSGVLSANCDTDCETKCSPCGVTNKTYFSPRSQGVNLALEKTSGWNGLVNRKDEDKFGGSIQAAFFLTGSREEKNLGRYFLFCGNKENTNDHEGGNYATNNCVKDCSDRCSFVDLRYGARVATTGAAPAVTAGADITLGSTKDLDLGLLLHLSNFTNGTTQSAATPEESDDAATTLQLCPEHNTIGALFQYRQELTCLLKGLYFDIKVPVAHVENKLRATTSGNDKEDLANYLSGKYSVAAGEINAQAALSCALMDAQVCNTDDCSKPCGNRHTETGVADVDLILGYQFLNKCDYHVAINLGVTIPTGNDNSGKHVFEAIVGNGGHVGFGVGLDADACLWSCDDHCLKALLAFNYRYLFRDSEVRTLGIKGANFGQYWLLIDKSSTAALNTLQLTPAANVTTLRVDVTPGSQFDGILALNYNWCGFGLDLGYNLFFRESECVKISCKESCKTSCGKVSSTFTDDKWAVAGRNLNMSLTSAANTTLSVANGNLVEGFDTINKANLDTGAASTPSLTSHKLYAGASYRTDWEVPVLVGVGGHYEWAKRDLISNWGFNAKLGIGF